MDPVTYVEQAVSTKSDKFYVPTVDRGIGWSRNNTPMLSVDVLHAIIGIVTECGELVDSGVEKYPDVINAREEFGDVMWYVAIYHHARHKKLCVDWGEKFDLQSMISTAAYMLDIAKKAMFYGKPVDYDDLDRMMNVIVSQVNGWCIKTGYDIEKLMTQNIAKLAKRFPEKFTEFHANNRDLAAEREVLEKGS